eukprot:3253500-Pleurochrysis_carterae.AAC.2
MTAATHVRKVTTMFRKASRIAPCHQVSAAGHAAEVELLSRGSPAICLIDGKFAVHFMRLVSLAM